MSGTRKWVIGAAVAGLTLTAAACGSSSNSTGAAHGTGTTFEKIETNSSGTPVKGGILNMVGSGDVDYLDPNISYYTTGYIALRMFSRQLYTYPAVEGKQTQVVPDLATAMPVVSGGGKTLTVTIKQGADWDTSPARQITAQDEIRGVETTCNPAEPFGGTPDFASLIEGYQAFCAKFAKVSPTPTAIKNFMASTSFAGVTVGSTPETIVFHLTQPATFFVNELAIPALSPRPVELLAYLPGSAEDAQHTVADGPYKVASYSPTHSIVFTRNPAWNASTDDVRKAYVNEIKVTEGEQQTSIEQQLQQGTPAADLPWDLGPTSSQANQLITQNYPELNVQSAYGTNPYIIFNTQSPNNNKALANPLVRQALSYAINRNSLIQDAGGAKLAPPLTHILPTGIDGSVQKDYYPYNPAKAKSLLAQAHESNLSLKFLYRPAEQVSTSMFQDVQAQLAKIGVTVTGVTASEADFYTKFLEVPSQAKSGVWDLSLSAWYPDWYGNAALSFFQPLFNGTVLPPSSSNFGLYNDPAVDSLISQASQAQTLSQSNSLWAQADQKTMQDAAIYPIDDPNVAFVFAPQVHNAIFMPSFNDFDPTNVWLDPSKNGD